MEQTIQNHEKEKLIPVEQVLEDMYNDGYAQSIARDYYYQNYATPDEQATMRREDKARDRFCAIFWISYILLISAAIIVGCLR